MKLFARLLLVALLSLSLAACPAFSTVLGDIGSTITKFSPLLSIAEGAACVAAGPVCTALSGVVKLAEPLAASVGTAFSSWSAASSAAQPGKLPQLVAAIQTWQASLKSGLAVPGLSASETTIIESELNYADDILATLEATAQSGGTTSALATVLREATPEYDEVSPVGVLAMFNPAHLVRTPRSYKLKNGAVVHAWAYHCDVMFSQLKKKTGSPAKDKANAELVAKIKALKW